MNRYQLAVRGDLFFTRAAFKQAGNVRVVNLLVDCGSSFTILSWGTFASLGFDPSASKVRQPIKTANGLV